MTRTVNTADNYMSRVLKHIPTEIVMAYITVDGVLRTSYNPNVWAERQTLQTLLWVVTAVLTVLTPFWLHRVMRVKRPTQLFISTLSVPVWLCPGRPFCFAGLVPARVRRDYSAFLHSDHPHHHSFRLID